jgi:hypothetical protein
MDLLCLIPYRDFLEKNFPAVNEEERAAFDELVRRIEQNTVANKNKRRAVRKDGQICVLAKPADFFESIRTATKAELLGVMNDRLVRWLAAFPEKEHPAYVDWLADHFGTPEERTLRILESFEQAGWIAKIEGKTGRGAIYYKLADPTSTTRLATFNEEAYLKQHNLVPVNKRNERIVKAMSELGLNRAGAVIDKAGRWRIGSAVRPRALSERPIRLFLEACRQKGLVSRADVEGNQEAKYKLLSQLEV